MKKVIKISLITLLSLILLVIIAMVVLAHVINPNDYKPQIKAMVLKQTGRTLTLDGDISWSFFPWLGFKAEKVALSNANGFGKQPMVAFNAVNASVKLLPLLSKEVEIKTLTLVDLKLNLMKNRQGVSNWQDMMGAGDKADNTTAMQQTRTDTSQAFKLNVSNIEISNAQLHWQDQQKKQNILVSNINLKAQDVGFGRTFPLTFSTRIEDKIKASKVDIKASSNVTMTKNLTKLDLNDIVLTVNNMTLNGKVHAVNVQTNFAANGDLAIKSFNPSQLLRSSGTKLALPSTALQKLAANLRFKATKDSINITPIKISLDDSTINGNASVKNFSKPVVNFSINADQLNVDRYMPATPKSTAPESTAPARSQPSGKPTQVDFSALRQYTVNGKLAITQLQAMNLKARDVSTKLSVKNGIARLSNMQAKLYQGSFAGNITLNAQTNTPKTQIITQLKNVQIQPLIQDLMGRNLATGVAAINTNLRTQGMEKQQAMNNLNGTLNFSLQNGEVRGVNVDHQIERIKALVNKTPMPGKATTNTTPFGDITGSAVINNGVANNPDLRIIAPTFTGNGVGIIDLARESINYTLQVRTLKAGDLNNYTLPLRITGSFDSPSIGIDPASVLQQVLKQQIRKQGQKALGKEGKKLLGNLFGR